MSSPSWQTSGDGQCQFAATFSDQNQVSGGADFLIPNVTDPAHFCANNFASASGAADAGQDIKFAKVRDDTFKTQPMK